MAKLLCLFETLNARALLYGFLCAWCTCDVCVTVCTIIVNSARECKQVAWLLAGWKREIGKPLPNTRMERSQMSFNGQDDRAHLFLVRVRAEDTRESLQPESKRWCGRVQRVVTGETYDFRGWTELIRRLGKMLDDTQASNDIDEQPS